MHHMAHKTNRSNQVQNLVKLGKCVTGRDEKAVVKTVSAFLKLLHPEGDAAPEHLNEYVEYALEGRRRVKEQLHKRKDDGEFADLDFSYFNQEGKEVFVTCPESASVLQTDSLVEEVTNLEEKAVEEVQEEKWNSLKSLLPKQC